MTYIYLTFPDAEAFAEYVKAKVLDRIGLTINITRSAAQDKITLIEDYFFRLTAKDVLNEEILLCDMLFNRKIGSEQQTEEQKKAMEAAEKKMKTWIDSTLKGFAGDMIEGEFTLHE